MRKIKAGDTIQLIPDGTFRIERILKGSAEGYLDDEDVKSYLNILEINRGEDDVYRAPRLAVTLI